MSENKIIKQSSFEYDEIIKSSAIKSAATKSRSNVSQINNDKPNIYNIDNENMLIIIDNILSETELKEYIEAAKTVERLSGKSGFGLKPRREICYSPNGESYKYSGINHKTIKYPDHVLKVIEIFNTKIDLILKEKNITNPYKTLCTGVDIIYDSTFPRGGSISAHKDDEDDYKLVIIYSLGQQRYLKVKRDKDIINTEVIDTYNVNLGHNRLVVMYGETFQKKYTHQVDKLSVSETVGIRTSLNVRYK